MFNILALSILGLSGCTPSPADQEAMNYVEAIEIPLKGRLERLELYELLDAQARRHKGLHVDDVSDRSEKFYRHEEVLKPNERPTVEITVWRGKDDDQLVAAIGDVMHRGRVWATFSRGQVPELERPFREAALAAILARWPKSQVLPVLPSGGLPLARDVVMTEEGYRIQASQGQIYGLSKGSDLLASN